MAQAAAAAKCAGDELPKRLLCLCGEMAAGRGCPGWAISPGASLQGFGGQRPCLPCCFSCLPSHPTHPKASGLPWLLQKCHPHPAAPIPGRGKQLPALAGARYQPQHSLPPHYPSAFPSAFGLLCWHFSPETLDFVATLASVMSGLYFKSLFVLFKKTCHFQEKHNKNLTKIPPQEPCASSTQSSSRCIHRVTESFHLESASKIIKSSQTPPCPLNLVVRCHIYSFFQHQCSWSSRLF